MNRDPRKDVIKDINKLIDAAGVDEEKAKELKNGIKLMGTCPCYEKGDKKEKKKREPTERSTFMGTCMRSPEKGGEGKNMKDCSEKWKEEKGIKEVKK